MPTVTDLTDMIARIRKDLHDEVSADYRWTDANLTRHIARALAEYNDVSPATTQTDVTVAADGQRSFDLYPATGTQIRETVLHVECPYTASTYDETEPSFVPFRINSRYLWILGNVTPSAGDKIRVWHTQPHYLNNTTATDLLTEELPIIELGAEAYASLERESYATERITVDGDTSLDYRTMGQRMLDRFLAILADRRRQHALRIDTRQVWDTSEA